jgi:Tudor domain
MSFSLLEQQFVIAFSAERKRHCRGRVYRISSDQRTARVHLIDYGSIDIIPVQDVVVMPDWVEDSVAPIARRSRMREIDYGFEPADPEAFKDTFSTVVNSRMLRGRILRDDFEGEFLDIELEFGPYYRPAGRFLQMMGFQRSLL